MKFGSVLTKSAGIKIGLDSSGVITAQALFNAFSSQNTLPAINAMITPELFQCLKISSYAFIMCIFCLPSLKW